MASHLTTLIKRVKAIPPKLKSEPVFFNKLINLAEYIRYESDYSDFEKRKAIAILKAYRLDHLVLIEDDENFEKAVRNLEIFKSKGYSRVCIRCGRTLTLNDSIIKGYGAECYSKRSVSLNKDLEDFL